MITLCFSKHLIEKLQTLLRVAYQANDFRLYRVVQGLLWLAEGRSIEEIAALLNVSKRTPYNWLKAFLSGGINWVQKERYQGRGRKSKLKKAQKKALYDMIVSGPEDNGFDCGIWNTAMINELIFRKFGVRYNPRYLSTLLKKMGLSYQKAGFITDRVDEEHYRQERKKWLEQTWPSLVKKAKQDKAVILFGDEVSFAMWGSLSRTWAPRAHQPLVKTKGVRKGVKMYGVIEFEGGAFHYMESLHYGLKPKSFRGLKQAGLPSEWLERLKTLKDKTFKTQSAFTKQLQALLGQEQTARYQSLILKHTEVAGRFNKEGYVEFLKQVLARFEGNIILIEDGAPYHKAALVKEFVESTQGCLTLERLPAFSPDFNPIEKLWKNTKRDATHLKYFETFEALRESVCKAFEKYLREASYIIRVMKKLRQEANKLMLGNEAILTC
ncbi:MAG: IS630 family transposase [Planctomycetes bacterium]|nr:IS630 family transposase [Planctomycetota bacterium]